MIQKLNNPFFTPLNWSPLSLIFEIFRHQAIQNKVKTGMSTGNCTCTSITTSFNRILTEMFFLSV